MNKLQEKLSTLEKYKKTYVGNKYNKLTVLDVIRDPDRCEYWFLTQCECGSEPKKVRKNQVVGTGRNNLSCGCVVSEKLNKQKIENNLSIAINQIPSFNKVLNYYKQGAKTRNLSFKLTQKQFETLILSDCKYCGSKPDKENKAPNGTLKHNGIDRLDNNIGYNQENCVSCCSRCNFFKGNLNSEVFIELIHNIYSKNKIKNGINEKKLDYYYDRAMAVSKKSPDEQTKVGSILINKESGAVLSDGYNGFVRGADDERLPKTRPEKYKYIVHSEQNLLYNCARHGISTKSCAIFVTLSPCQNCTRALYQSGITTIYFKDKYRDFEDQIKLGDLRVEIEKIGCYTKIELFPNKDFK